MIPATGMPVRSEAAIARTNKLIRNTYTLLSMTLLFSAVMAGVSIAVGAPPLGLLGLLGFFGLFFLTAKLRNSAWGLLAVFALTGFMGFTLGPIINMYLGLPNGPQIVMTAMGATGIIFLSLSAYVLTTRKNFNFMAGFLMAGLVVAIVAVIANLFLAIPALSLAISAVIAMLMAGFILFDTSRLIHGGEDNYIMATIALYVDLYNLFLSLLQLIGAFSGDD
jgi:modulator of FtsH protease